MADQEWIVGDGANAIGPLTTDQLKALAGSGKITRDTQLRTTSMAKTVPARRVLGLFPQEAETLETLGLPDLPVTPPASEPAPVERDGLGIPLNESLFKDEPPVQTTRRLIKPLIQSPQPMAMKPLTPQLEPPRWQDLWPLAITILGIGWLLGGHGLTERFFLPDSVGAILLIGTAAVTMGMAAFIHWLRPRHVPIGSTVGIGIFTSICGVLSLLGLQFCATFVAGGGLRIYGRLGLVLLVLSAIGWAYHLTGSDSLLLRWVGFVFGVGLCEETVKMLPLIWLLLGTAHRRMGIHTFMTLGFASGMGFGITEALYIYNPWHGTSIQGQHMADAGSNLIRWFSLVPSHGLWTAMCAGFLWKRQSALCSADGFWERALEVAKAAGAMALLHGTYDTLCTLGLIAAFAFSAATFPILVWLTNRFTVEEADPADIPSQSEAAIFHRRPVLVGWFTATALFIAAAMSLTVNEGEYDKGLDKTRMAELRALLPRELRPYADSVRIHPDEGPLEPLQSVFSFDRIHPEHGITGVVRNLGTTAMLHVVFTCTDIHGQETIFTRKAIAPGGETHFDNESEWSFAPGEKLAVSWDGHEEPLHFTLP